MRGISHRPALIHEPAAESSKPNRSQQRTFDQRYRPIPLKNSAPDRQAPAIHQVSDA
jgi:hypothetical protein